MTRNEPKPKYVNFDDLVEQPDSGRVEATYQSLKTTLIYEAPYAIAYPKVPAIGQNINGEIVTSSCLEPVKGGAARLIFTVEARNSAQILEVTWQQAQLPLERHPRYAVGGVKALSNQDLVMLQQWKATPDPTYAVTNPAGTLSPNAQDFAAKWARGQDNYLIFTPTARRTQINYLVLTTGGLLGSYSSSMPFNGCPTGYKWLKVGDNATFDSGFWSRVEEWQGYDTLDPDIYGP